ncbi:MAG: hypothetical protein HQ562_03560 [Candidatus Marinimicrobia bacterium]|nr:hypothetical protein [Candidatus Neomarinimicrobiota bacterium]
MITLRKTSLAILLGIALWSCSLWEYADPSDPLTNAAPETYLTVVANDTLFPVESADSSWYYIIGLDSIPIQGPDTLTDAFATISTSRQVLNWWGEDSDGEVIGYLYKWNSDADWTYTTRESGIFYVPIRTVLDVFWFDIKAIDNSARWDYDRPATAVSDSADFEYISDIGDTINVLDAADVFLDEGALPGIQTPLGAPLRPLQDNELFYLPPTETEGAVDLSSAKLVFPIRNSSPEISFRYQSNPTYVAQEVRNDTAYTFPTRTFVWDLYDLDGLETVTNIYYALDDTCDTCWNTLDAAAYTSYTLTGLKPGFRTIYLKTSDIAGAESKIIQYPDTSNTDEPDFWKVMPVVGNLLLVDDYPLDSQNNSNRWYKSVLDSVVGSGNYSTWEIGYRLPFSTVDISANLKYFDHVIWYTAYNGIETYREAESNINSFVLGGGNLFMIASELKDTTFTWFPLTDTYVVNPNGRLWPGRILESGISAEYDVAVAKMIAIRLRAFEPDSALFVNYQELYHLQDPTAQDQWVGNPVMAGMGRFQVSATRLSGLAGLMTITLHDGYDSTLEETGIINFFDYLINEAFVQ